MKETIIRDGERAGADAAHPDAQYQGLEQARETTIANTAAAAPRQELIHPGVLKYLSEIKR